MLTFITSLRHPTNSADYGRVERLLEGTLRSVAAQTSDDWTCIVVGNREPAFALPERVEFVGVDFAAPVPTPGPQTPLGPFVWDKGTKIGIGLAAARRHRPDHVMIFDADDFVHRRLAQWASGSPKAPGWVIDRGYIYSGTRQCIRPLDVFNRTCGTCHIVNWSAYGVPDDLEVTADQATVSAAFGDTLTSVLGAHRDGLAWFERHGYPLQPLPFRGAVYHVDTHENHSGKGLTGLARPLTAQLSTDFTIPRAPRLGHAMAAGFGARAVGESLEQQTRRAARKAALLRRRVRPDA